MNVPRFNGSERAARINAQQHLPELERAYEQLIRRAARQAATNLRAQALTAATQPPAAGNPDWQLPAEGVLLTAAALIERAAKRLSKLHRRIVATTTRPPLARVGIAWDVTHPLSQHLLDLSARRTGERLDATVQPLLREVIVGAYAQGLSVRDTAALIRERFAEAARGQAAMLARTDLNSLANGGSVMAAQIVGVQWKQWLTAEDDRVRETHAEADGQTVPIDQPFDVGGESLDYPGDPGGSDEEVANCRCTVIYLDAEEALAASAQTAGRVPSLGMRRANGPVALPPEMNRIPGRGFAAAAVEAPEAPAGTGWVADIAFEGMATSDGRYILPDALDWRELPITLGFMRDTPHAHVVTESPGVGKIEFVSKETTNMNGDDLPDGVMAIRGHGVFASDAESQDAQLMVSDEMIRGISIDLAVDESCFRDPETGDLVDPAEASDEDMERAFFGELQFAVVKGTIMAATVCPTPAFADARIALAASSDGRRVIRLWAPFMIEAAALSASAAGLAPAKPPRAWFYTAEAEDPTPLTVTKDGRVFGHVALWESCHTGYPGQCLPPPKSESGYTFFNLGEVESAEGDRVAVGSITLEALHADSHRPLSPDAVRAHYEHTGVVAAYVRAVDGTHGIWVSGALRANLSERHARDLMGAKPSGDWRQIRPGGPLEMLGVHAVNEPGYPVPRLVAAALLPSGDRAVLEFAEPSSGRIPARGFARV